MIARQHVEPNFFDQAEEMRGVLDANFDRPYEDTTTWQYYAVPQLYTYLRTTPRSVFPEGLFQRFVGRLSDWSFEHLGLVPIGDPTLHLMVNGCSLSLHSDFHNGAWGYVYSLTRWDTRTFSGGETLLLRDGIPSYKKHQAHGSTLFELIPARFNQLLVFDDRIAHATPTIEGSMASKEARIAMVGHIRATGPKVTGPLPAPAGRQVIAEMLPGLAKQLQQYKEVQGTMSYRLQIAPSGEVTSVAVLTGNLVVPPTGYGKSDAVAAAKATLHETLSRLRFPAAADASHVTLAILVPVPDLRAVQVAVSHGLAKESALRCVGSLFSRDVLLGRGTAKFGLTGTQQSDEFIVHEPADGVIRVTADTISASFEAPMWVPSQRAQFEQDVTELLKANVASAARAE